MSFRIDMEEEYGDAYAFQEDFTVQVARVLYQCSPNRGVLVVYNETTDALGPALDPRTVVAIKRRIAARYARENTPIHDDYPDEPVGIRLSTEALARRQLRRLAEEDEVANRVPAVQDDNPFEVGDLEEGVPFLPPTGAEPRAMHLRGRRQRVSSDRADLRARRLSREHAEAMESEPVQLHIVPHGYARRVGSAAIVTTVLHILYTEYDENTNYRVYVYEDVVRAEPVEEDVTTRVGYSETEHMNKLARIIQGMRSRGDTDLPDVRVPKVYNAEVEAPGMDEVDILVRRAEGFDNEAEGDAGLSAMIGVLAKSLKKTNDKLAEQIKTINQLRRENEQSSRDFYNYKKEMGEYSLLEKDRQAAAMQVASNMLSLENRLKKIENAALLGHTPRPRPIRVQRPEQAKWVLDTSPTPNGEESKQPSKKPKNPRRGNGPF